jgi:formylmethanofuran dehydrogenase subunit E
MVRDVMGKELDKYITGNYGEEMLRDWAEEEKQWNEAEDRKTEEKQEKNREQKMKPEQHHCDQCHEIKPDLKEHCGEILCTKCRYFAENGEERNDR